MLLQLRQRGLSHIHCVQRAVTLHTWPSFLEGICQLRLLRCDIVQQDRVGKVTMA